MNKDSKIGIFDSGIGGVTVLKEIIKILPNEQYIYYSDSIHNPYGDKSDEQIIKNCDEIVKYFIDNNCKAIVIACNTASTKAVQILREKYKDMLFIAIEPAYKMVYDYSYNEPTLVMATKGTIESERFNILFNKYNNHKTYLMPCIGLANLIEDGEKEELIKYLKDNLLPYRGKIKNVVLGCTHYPLIQEEIKNILGDIIFFNGATRLAVYLKKLLEKNGLLNDNNEMNEKNLKEKIIFIDSKQSEEKEKRFWKIILSY